MGQRKTLLKKFIKEKVDNSTVDIQICQKA